MYPFSALVSPLVDKDKFKSSIGQKLQLLILEAGAKTEVNFPRICRLNRTKLEYIQFLLGQDN